MMRGKGKWEPATVITINKDGPHSYILNTPEGQRYRRNRCHLKATPTSVRRCTVNRNWLEDMYETDTSEAPAEQGSGSPPPYNFVDLKEQSGSHQGILTRTTY